MSSASPEQPREQLFRVHEAAELLGVHESTIRRYIKNGELAAVTLGQNGKFRIRRSALESLIGEPVKPKIIPAKSGSDSNNRRKAPSFTYLAVREHPTEGLLVKVGTSIEPDRRCDFLRAKRIGKLLPSTSEAALHVLLHDKRVWLESVDGTQELPRPLFPAHTEWFYATPNVGELLRAHIKACGL